MKYEEVKLNNLLFNDNYVINSISKILFFSNYTSYEDVFLYSSFNLNNKLYILQQILPTNIYSALTNESIHEVEILFENANYGEFKRAVADKVCEFLIDIQSKYNKL